LNSQKKEKARFLPPPQPTPVNKLSPSMVWNTSIGQVGLATWLCSLPAPACLLSSWTWETSKSPWFHSNDWKECLQHSSSTKPKTQQLLGGKLTLSQPRPGQMCQKTTAESNLSKVQFKSKFSI